MLKTRHFTLLLTLFLAACATSSKTPKIPVSIGSLQFPGEVHLKNIRQITAGGTNAEAYWSFDGKWLTLQAKGTGLHGIAAPGPACDQIYRVRPDGSDAELVSTGKGRTTCSFYTPDDDRIIYSSTHAANLACPTEPDRSRGYVWPIYESYQLYSVQPGKPDSIIPMEPGAPRAYNAEAVTCRDGSLIFTSDRDGDLELYTAKIDSQGLLKDIKRITHTPGYDGGAFFSQDCKKIVWRASRPKNAKELQDYQELLKQHLVRPSQLEIFTADADGKNARQVTRLGAATFAPYFTPKADRILFSSNFEDPQGRSFAIYSIRTDGTGIKRITYSGVFDGFPMFSPDGKKIAFSSNRNGSKPRETNVFVADWVETPEESQKEVSLEDTDPANRFMATVKALSAPEFAGRGIGTPQMAQAEDFTVSLFVRAGIEPFFKQGSKGFKKAAATTRPDATGYKHAVQIRPLEQKEQKVSDTLVSGNNTLGTWGQGCAKGVAPVVIGAHLDHLGMGAPGSLEATKKGIHHGADDNASGVAGVLEAARLIQQDPAAKAGCFIFAAFTGEESGVAGSARVAELLKSSGILPKAMLNLDMVGRLRNNQLIIFGSQSATEWKPWIEAECMKLGLTCPGGGDGYGPSDQMPFYMKGAPVLHFFTGPHSDYHRVSDTFEKINATGGIQVAQAVAALALKASRHPGRLHYQKPSSQPHDFGATPGVQARSGMGGAYLGTIPDYAQLTSPSGPGGDASQGGVLLSGARAGSPAEKAGVQAGDVIFEVLKVESKERLQTRTLAEFMQVLRTLKSGDAIVLGVRRAQKNLELNATVGSRSSAESKQ
ncbi:MAG: M20/M25/M40 family metallo-hydrolase [Oligoflexia bacterium]